MPDPRQQTADEPRGKPVAQLLYEAQLYLANRCAFMMTPEHWCVWDRLVERPRLASLPEPAHA